MPVNRGIFLKLVMDIEPDGRAFFQTQQRTGDRAVDGDGASPYLFCPPDVTVDLPSDAPTVSVRIPQPRTNADWFAGVRATPGWAKGLEAELGQGKTLVTFQVILHK